MRRPPRNYLARTDPGVILPEPYPCWSWTVRSFRWQGCEGYGSPDLVAVAFHEAAHALFAEAVGAEVELAAICLAGRDITEGNAGIVKHVQSKRCSRPISEEQLRTYARISPRFVLAIAAEHAAGIQAEMILSGAALYGVVPHHKNDLDIERVLYWIDLAGIPRLSGLGYVQRYARAVLTHNWTTVAKLAEAILDEHVIYGDRVRSIIGKRPELPGVEVVNPPPPTDSEIDKAASSVNTREG